jgi:prevent-host-death family protein
VKIVNIHEAKTHLSRLLDVAAGEEIVIAKAGRPIARIVPVAGQRARARAGHRRGPRGHRRRFRRTLVGRDAGWIRALRILLDSRCWLWMLAAPDRFSTDARDL